jgi:hypothetical protein
MVMAADQVLERLTKERDELREKIRRLQAFLNGAGARDLPVAEAELLMAQVGAMAEYLSILDRRITRAGRPPPPG